MLCDQLQISSTELIGLANNRHPRVDILDPGIGVGGHCIAIDPVCCIHVSEGHNDDPVGMRLTEKNRVGDRSCTS